MFYIGFAIRNPWSDRWSIVKNWTVPVSVNKTVEIGIYRNNSIVGGSVNVKSFRQDHAGVSIDLELLSWNFNFEFYDRRQHNERTD